MNWRCLLGHERDIAIVGSGPIDPRHGPKIDQHEIVIRFNACQNYGASGLKTDVLVLVNTGWSGKTLSRTPDAIHQGALAAAEDFWFPRHPKLINTQRRLRPIAPDAEDQDLWTDFSHELIDNHVGDRPFKYILASHYRAAQRCLEKLGSTQDFEPSTGFLTLYHLRRQIRPSRVTLYGFTHEGWGGHAWAAEKALIQQWGIPYGDRPLC